MSVGVGEVIVDVYYCLRCGGVMRRRSAWWEDSCEDSCERVSA